MAVGLGPALPVARQPLRQPEPGAGSAKGPGAAVRARARSPQWLASRSVLEEPEGQWMGLAVRE